MENPESFNPKPRARYRPPREFKIVAVRDCPAFSRLAYCTKPQDAADYWRACIATADWYCSERECLAAIFMNTRGRILGHHLIAIGSLDNVAVSPREVFRAAIIAATSTLVIGHNHPSGDPMPSHSDIEVTRHLIRAGKLLRISVVDHVIIGDGCHCSLKEHGYFYE